MRDAILSVIKEMDSVFDAEMVLERIKEKYGDRASDRISTIKASLNVLSKTNEVIEVGKNTGCYRRP